MLENPQLEGLLACLESFVSGRDRSMRFVSEAERFLTGEFYDDPEFEDLVIAVASYSPGNPEMLHEEHLLPLCRRAIVVIAQRLGRNE